MVLNRRQLLAGAGLVGLAIGVGALGHKAEQVRNTKHRDFFEDYVESNQLRSLLRIGSNGYYSSRDLALDLAQNEKDQMETDPEYYQGPYKIYEDISNLHFTDSERVILLHMLQNDNPNQMNKSYVLSVIKDFKLNPDQGRDKLKSYLEKFNSETERENQQKLSSPLN